MEHSAGLIPFRKNKNNELEFFVGHPGGQSWNPYWAFLKGGINEGENAFDAALREFGEESGVIFKDVTPEDVISLGSVQQNRHKIVTAFGIEFPHINPEDCFSNLCEDGVTPEIDKYKWMTYAELKDVTHKKHLVFYQQLLDLIQN